MVPYLGIKGVRLLINFAVLKEARQNETQRVLES